MSVDARPERRRRPAFLAIVLLGLLTLGAGRTELEKTLPQGGLPSERDTWSRFETPAFTILSSASRQRTLAIARQLEGLRSAFGQITQLEARSPVPTSIYIFADNASLHPYKHLYDGEPASMSGALYSRPWGDYIAMNGSRRSEAAVTVFHEYVHVVMRNNLPGIPLWLEEGLAEFFSTFRLEKNGGRLGRPVPWHLNELRRGELEPLRNILTADVSSELYNRFEHQGEFYARSWELTHYLLLGRPERLGQTLDFLSRTFQGAPLDRAFQGAFGMDIRALDAELTAYRQNGYRSTLLQLPPADFSKITAHPVDYAELLFHLGELLTSQGERAGDAAFHYRQALERRPDFGRAVTGLGLLAQQDGDLPRARALFARAVELTDAPRSHYFYGHSLLSLGRAVSRAKRQEARRHLERSVQLDPSFAPAWVSLGQARYLEAPRGEGTKREAAAMPASASVALDVLMLYSRSRNRDAAQGLWNQYFKSGPDSPERRAAARVLQRLDWLERGGPNPAMLRPPRPRPPKPAAPGPSTPKPRRPPQGSPL
ncbi:MAG: tetratricopeptide repeat protein [Acidobacteriota bacterium]